MDYILLASKKIDIIKKASDLLSHNGLEILLVTNGTDAAKYISAREPRILFVDTFFDDVLGFDIISMLKDTYPNGISNIVYADTFYELNNPIIDWQWHIDVYLQTPFTSWQLALCIEQCLYRNVKPNSTEPPDFAETKEAIEQYKKDVLKI